MTTGAMVGPELRDADERYHRHNLHAVQDDSTSRCREGFPASVSQDPHSLALELGSPTLRSSILSVYALHAHGDNERMLRKDERTIWRCQPSLS